VHKKTVAVITAYFSKTPPPFLPPHPAYQVDHFLFSNFNLTLPGWKTITFSGLEDDTEYKHRKLAKLPKIVSHVFLPDYEWFVWHDYNQALRIDPLLVIDYLDKNDALFAGFQHSLRNCVYDEAELVRNTRDSPEAIDAMTCLLKENGILRNSGLYELTAFYRKNSPKLNQAFTNWMEIINSVSSRDQLSFPLILKKFQINNIQLLAGTAQKHVGGGNGFFTQYKDPLVLASKHWK
jgi:hypothetical protein